MDVSVLGSEAAAALRAAGVVGAVVDGAVRDVEGLTATQLPVLDIRRHPDHRPLAPGGRRFR